MESETPKSYFRRAARRGSSHVTVVVDGCTLEMGEEDTVASAILLASGRPSRLSAVTGQPRTPFCMMGSCFECLKACGADPLRH